jgi:hypothetical protein
VPSSIAELAWSAVISLVITGLGTYYLIREIAGRRRNVAHTNLPEADRSHFHWQFVRRVIGSSLLIIAGVGIFIGQGLLDWTQTPLLYFSLWLGVMLGLFGLVCLAGADIIGIRRYAERQRRRLEDDRREMINRQLEQYRAEKGEPSRLPPDFDVERN